MVKYLFIIFLFVSAGLIFVFNFMSDSDGDLESETHQVAEKSGSNNSLNSDLVTNGNRAPSKVDKKKFALEFLSVLSKGIMQNRMHDGEQEQDTSNIKVKYDAASIVGKHIPGFKNKAVNPDKENDVHEDAQETEQAMPNSVENESEGRKTKRLE